MRIFLCINIGANVHTAGVCVCVYADQYFEQGEASVGCTLDLPAEMNDVECCETHYSHSCPRLRLPMLTLQGHHLTHLHLRCAHKIHFMILLQGVSFASMGQPIIFHKFQKEQHLLGSSQNKDCWGIWYLFHVYIRRSQAVIDLLSLHSGFLLWVLGREASCSKVA